MNEDLEKRISDLERQLHSQKTKKLFSTKRRRILLIIAALALCFFAGGAALWQYHHITTSGLPKALSFKTSYKIYYFHGAIPYGYKLDENDIVNDQNTLRFKLTGKLGDIQFVEQPAPPNQVQLSSIPNFVPLGVQTGEAIIGQVSGMKTVILRTNSTLINITAPPTLDDQVFIDIVQALKAY